MPQHSAPVNSLDEYVEQYEVLQNVPFIASAKEEREEVESKIC